MSLFSKDQLDNIVSLIIDEYGSDLTEGEISEATGLILEDISGCEALEPRSLDHVMTIIRNQYYDATKSSP